MKLLSLADFLREPPGTVFQDLSGGLDLAVLLFVWPRGDFVYRPLGASVSWTEMTAEFPGSSARWGMHDHDAQFLVFSAGDVATMVASLLGAVPDEDAMTLLHFEP